MAQHTLFLARVISLLNRLSVFRSMSQTTCCHPKCQSSVLVLSPEALHKQQVKNKTPHRVSLAAVQVFLLSLSRSHFLRLSFVAG